MSTEQNMNTSTPMKKLFQKADYSVFEETCQALGKSSTEVCDALGYSSNAWVEWKKEGKMPRVAAIACEGIRRRNGLSDRVYLVKVTTKDQENALQALFKGLGVEFVNV